MPLFVPPDNGRKKSSRKSRGLVSRPCAPRRSPFVGTRESQPRGHPAPPFAGAPGVETERRHGVPRNRFRQHVQNRRHASRHAIDRTDPVPGVILSTPQRGAPVRIACRPSSTTSGRIEQRLNTISSTASSTTSSTTSSARRPRRSHALPRRPRSPREDTRRARVEPRRAPHPASARFPTTPFRARRRAVLDDRRARLAPSPMENALPLASRHRANTARHFQASHTTEIR